MALRDVVRLKGVLLLQRQGAVQAEAEACFQQAIAVAQQQSAKSWELRAATSLARLWQGRGKRVEAHDLLAPVYNWFTEGFDTADLKDAKALLESCSRHSRLTLFPLAVDRITFALQPRVARIPTLPRQSFV